MSAQRHMQLGLLLGASFLSATASAQTRLTMYGEYLEYPRDHCRVLFTCYYPFPFTVVELADPPPDVDYALWTRVDGVLVEPGPCDPEVIGRLTDIAYSEGAPLDLGVGTLRLDRETMECHLWDTEPYGLVGIEGTALPDSAGVNDLFRVFGTMRHELYGECGLYTVLATEVRPEPSPTIETSWGEIKTRYR